MAQKCGRWFFGPFASQKRCQAGFASHEAANFGARCGGNSEIEVAPNFARTRLRRGRNSNLVLYLCANPIAGCMALLNGAGNRWSRAFLGRGNTLDNPISSLPSSSSPKPYQFDFCIYFQRELGNTWPSLTVSRVWLLVKDSTSVWNAWPCLIVFRIWRLVIPSTGVWNTWPSWWSAEYDIWI